mmetsp:Transcript_12633/g.26643  ORF Transcript_12633/g.26643 Transcript_12633/m.26643 type:complete len:642 (+) Transcript_12633:206-2131(+)
MLAVMDHLGDDGGGLAAGELLQLGHLEGEGDEVGQALLGVQPVLALVRLVLLNVQADGGARGAGAGEAEDDARAVGEDEAQALALGHGPVDGVGVLEVIRNGHLVVAHLRARRALRLDLADVVHHGLRLVGLAALVVVAREKVAPERLPVVHGDVLHRHQLAARGHVLVLVRQDAQPRQHRPDAVLLADVVSAGAEGLLAADGELAGVHEIAEELPPGGGLEEGHAHLLRHAVQGRGGGHGARQTLDAALEVGDGLGVGGDHGDGVGGGDEEVVAQDHVAIAVAVGRRAKHGRRLAEHGRHQLLRVRQVGVGMSPAKVLEGGVVGHGGLGGAELVAEDGLGVGAGDGVQSVKLHRELGAGQQALDHVEVEALLEELQVVRDAVDHLHLKVVKLGHANLGEVDVGDVGHLEGLHLLGVAEDLVGDLLGRGLAAGVVELDAPVLGGPAGVVGGGHDEAAVRLALADHRGGGGGGQDGVLPHVHLLDAVARGQLQDDLRRLLVEVAPIAAQHHGAALELGLRESAEEGLHPVAEVVLAHEDVGLLAQPGGASLLAVDGLGGDLRHRHGIDGERLTSARTGRGAGHGGRELLVVAQLAHVSGHGRRAGHGHRAGHMAGGSLSAGGNRARLGGAEGTGGSGGVHGS